MVKIISFDVGIKNLAYCIIEFDTSNHSHTILDWGVINIMENILSRSIKCSVVKKGIQCNGYATVCIHSENNKIVFCKKKLCQKTVETAYSKKDIKKIKPINTKTLSLLELATELVKELNKYESFLDADIAVIENQPVLKNPTMKSVQMILYSFFVIKGITVDKPLSNIALFNAGRKLDIYNGPDIKTTCEKGSYSERKKLSIEITKSLLKDLPNKLTFFMEHKKQDDLADCFLQCLTYYKKKLNA